MDHLLCLTLIKSLWCINCWINIVNCSAKSTCITQYFTKNKKNNKCTMIISHDPSFKLSIIHVFCYLYYEYVLDQLRNHHKKQQCQKPAHNKAICLRFSPSPSIHRENSAVHMIIDNLMTLTILAEIVWYHRYRHTTDDTPVNPKRIIVVDLPKDRESFNHL